jgi:hypothetical protein
MMVAEVRDQEPGMRVRDWGTEYPVLGTYGVPVYAIEISILVSSVGSRSWIPGSGFPD